MTATTVTEPRPPMLRLVPAPRTDPPYDDEVPPPGPVVDGTLALAFPTPPQLLPLRLVPPADPLDDDDGHAPPPDARQWSRRLAQAVVEVLAGVRAAAQLSRYATFEVLEQLERATGRLGGRPDGAPARRPAVVNVRVCQPHAFACEVAAVIDTGRRHRALAVRLDADHGRWRCTSLHLG
jgi:hypothetical protein